MNINDANEYLIAFRLIAEKVNKNERKGLSTVIGFNQGNEEPEFWDVLGGPPTFPITVIIVFYINIKKIIVTLIITVLIQLSHFFNYFIF